MVDAQGRQIGAMPQIATVVENAMMPCLLRSKSSFRVVLCALALTATIWAQPSTANDSDEQAALWGTRGDSPLVAQALDIEAMLDDGDDTAAIAAARDLLRMVTNRTGFGVTGAQLTVSPATGYGVYALRPSNVYEPGEPIFAYIEVYGFSLLSQRVSATGPNSEPVNIMSFDVSFTLDTPEGEQVTEALIPMGEVNLSSYREPIDGYFQLTYRITGAQGDYVLRTHVVDRESGQSAEFRLPVVFAHQDEASDDKALFQ